MAYTNIYTLNYDTNVLKHKRQLDIFQDDNVVNKIKTFGTTIIKDSLYKSIVRSANATVNQIIETLTASGGNPITISYQNNKQTELFASFNSSSIKLDLISQNNYSLIEFANPELLEYRLDILDTDNSSLFFRGYNIRGLYKEPYQQPPYTTQVEYTDGIPLLKEFSFVDFEFQYTKWVPVFYTGFDTVMNVIKKILDKLNLDYDYFVACYMWTVEDRDIFNYNDDDFRFLERCYIDQELWKETESQNPENCYKVLLEILSTFGLKLQVGPHIVDPTTLAWYITHIKFTELLNDPNYGYVHYDKDLTVINEHVIKDWNVFITQPDPTNTNMLSWSGSRNLTLIEPVDNVVVTFNHGKEKQPFWFLEFDKTKQDSEDYLKEIKKTNSTSQTKYFSDILDEPENNAYPLFVKSTQWEQTLPNTGLINIRKSFGDYYHLETQLGVVPFSTLKAKRIYELIIDCELVGDDAVYDEEGKLDDQAEPVRSQIFYFFIRRPGTWTDNTDWFFLHKDYKSILSGNDNLYQWSPQIDPTINGIRLHNVPTDPKVGGSLATTQDQTRYVVNNRKAFTIDVEFADDLTADIIGADKYTDGPGELLVHIRQPQNCNLKLYSIKFKPKENVPPNNVSKMPETLASTKLRTFNKTTILGSAPSSAATTYTNSIRGITFNIVSKTYNILDNDAAVFRRGVLYQQNDKGWYECGRFDTPLNSKMKLNEILRDWYFQDKKLPKQKIEGTIIGNLSPMNFVTETITQNTKFHILKLTKSDRSDENKVMLYAFDASLPETEVLPSSITDLKITDNIFGHVKLGWSAPTNDGGAPLQLYRIYRSEDDGITFILVNQFSTNQLFYDDVTVDLDTRYLYYCTSLTGVGESAPSNMVSVQTVKNDILPPTELIAETRTFNSINLTWTTSIATIDNPLLSYSLYREDSVPKDGLVVTTPRRLITDSIQSTATSYLDQATSGLVEDSFYRYWLVAVNQIGESMDSNSTTEITFLQVPTVASKIVNWNVEYWNLINGINIIWETPDTGGTLITGYEIERRIDINDVWIKIADIGVGINYHYDLDLSENDTVEYRIRTVNLVGDSVWSDTLSITQGFTSGIVKPPTTIQAFAEAITRVKITWRPALNQFYDYYVILKSSNFTTEITTLQQVDNNVFEYVDSDIVNSNLTYSYWLQGFLNGTASLKSVEAQVEPNDYATPPINLSITVQSPTDLILNWEFEGNLNTLIEYKIYRRIFSTSAWNHIGTSTTNNAPTAATVFTVSDHPASGITYEYSISAISTEGESPKSESELINTDLSRLYPPLDLIVTQTNADIILTWTNPTITGQSYVIQRQNPDSRIPASDQFIFDSTNTITWTDTNLADIYPGEYSYRVAVAEQTGGLSVGNYSSWVDITVISFSTTPPELTLEPTVNVIKTTLNHNIVSWELYGVGGSGDITIYGHITSPTLSTATEVEKLQTFPGMYFNFPDQRLDLHSEEIPYLMTVQDNPFYTNSSIPRGYTTPVITQVVNLTVTQLTAVSVRLNWSPVNIFIDTTPFTYSVWRKDSDNSNFIKVQSGLTTTTWDDTNLSLATYIYQVEAEDVEGNTNRKSDQVIFETDLTTTTILDTDQPAWDQKISIPFYNFRTVNTTLNINTTGKQKILTINYDISTSQETINKSESFNTSTSTKTEINSLIRALGAPNTETVIHTLLPSTNEEYLVGGSTTITGTFSLQIPDRFWVRCDVQDNMLVNGLRIVGEFIKDDVEFIISLPDDRVTPAVSVEIETQITADLLTPPGAGSWGLATIIQNTEGWPVNGKWQWQFDHLNLLHDTNIHWYRTKYTGINGDTNDWSEPFYQGVNDNGFGQLVTDTYVTNVSNVDQIFNEYGVPVYIIYNDRIDIAFDYLPCAQINPITIQLDWNAETRNNTTNTLIDSKSYSENSKSYNLNYNWQTFADPLSTYPGIDGTQANSQFSREITSVLSVNRITETEANDTLFKILGNVTNQSPNVIMGIKLDIPAQLPILGIITTLVNTNQVLIDWTAFTDPNSQDDNSKMLYEIYRDNMLIGETTLFGDINYLDSPDSGTFDYKIRGFIDDTIFGGKMSYTEFSITSTINVPDTYGRIYTSDDTSGGVTIKVPDGTLIDAKGGTSARLTYEPTDNGGSVSFYQDSGGTTEFDGTEQLEVVIYTRFKQSSGTWSEIQNILDYTTSVDSIIIDTSQNDYWFELISSIY